MDELREAKIGVIRDYLITAKRVGISPYLDAQILIDRLEDLEIVELLEWASKDQAIFDEKRSSFNETS